MNTLECNMVDALKDLKENHYVIGVKAEFEAEGTRMDEMLRLKEVCERSGLGLTIKIGGCEAVRDMYECRVIGVERVVAPMVESAFALKKFLAATKLAFTADERKTINFCVNVETIAGCKAFPEMITLPEIDLLNGVVMGRVDLTGSMGLTREDINHPRVLELTRKLFEQAKKKNLETAVGGGVSAHSLPFLRELSPVLIDRYETRKVVFKCPEAVQKNADKGILKAVGFELMWLKNKRDYYHAIAIEDDQRITLLESRYKTSIEAAGGKYE